MTNEYANAERWKTGGKHEYRCDVCLKWHKSTYGVQMTASCHNYGCGVRRKLCAKCAKKYAEQIKNAFDIISGIDFEPDSYEKKSDYWDKYVEV